MESVSETVAEFAPPRRRARPRARSRRGLKGFAVFGALLIVAYLYPLGALVRHAFNYELHSHIVLIPLLSAYLIFRRRRQPASGYQSSLGESIVAGSVGLTILGVALFLRQTLSWNDFLALLTASFLAFLLGGGFFFLGRSWVKALAFPIGFLVFMIPLPDGAVVFLEQASAAASAKAAELFLQLSGMPVLREGNFLQLPGIALEVAQECSGIRSSWVLFITSVLAAHLFLRGGWRRMALLAFVIPLGIVRNGLRIFVLGWLCVNRDPAWIHSSLHREGGPLFFALSLVPLFGLLCWLRRDTKTPATREQN